EDYEPCSAIVTFSGLDNGPHTLFVVAADEGCLVDETPAMWSWLIDTTQPETAFVTTPPSQVGSTEASSFTYEDPNEPERETFECQLDGGEWFSCDPDGYDAGVLDVGPHMFAVRSCSELSDRCDQTPAIYTWTVSESVCPRDR